MKPRTVFACATCIGCLIGALGANGPAWAAFPGQNGKIAFDTDRDSGTPQVYAMDADGSNLTNVSGLSGGGDFQPNWSPDGTRIVFGTFRGGANSEIYVMNADGTDQTNLTHAAGFNQQPAWSPDGTQIAFTVHASIFDQAEIYVMNADGTDQSNITDFVGNDNWPAWSPNGNRIAFAAERDGGAYEIYVMDPDGSNPTNLTNDEANDTNPSWSPDGTRIAFCSSRADGLGDIYVMDADGSNPVNLTNYPVAIDAEPAWSPDGTKIAFRSFRDGNSEIYVMNADGTGQTNLTNNPADDSWPDWQPVLGNGSDSDGDGIPDDKDVEGIQEAIEQLPSSAFKKGNGFPNALYSILEDVEAAIALGDTGAAVEMLESLRRHVDGCHPAADKNDWIVDCSKQVEIRALIDALISNLEG